MKVAIVGSRSITDRDYVTYHLDMLLGTDKHDSHVCLPITVLSGGASGVDTIAREWAEAYGFDFVLFKPYHMIDDKAAYSPRYFFTRNKQIVDNADKVIVFWDGVSTGTKHVIEYSKKRGKPLEVISND